MRKSNMNITLSQVKMLNSLILVGFFVIMLVAIVEGFVIVSTVKNQKTILVPAGFNQKMSLTSQLPDNQYLISTTKDILSSKLNITPYNVHQSFNWLLTYVSSDNYVGFSQQLKNEARKIKDANMSASFYPSSWDVTNNLQVVMTGVLKKYVGKRALPIEQASYLVKYSYPNGFIRLKSIEKVKVSN